MPQLTLFESKLPMYAMGDKYVAPIGDARKGVLVELRCPRKGCEGWFTLAVRYLKASRFWTRPCPYCFRTAQLPEELRRHVATEPPRA